MTDETRRHSPGGPRPAAGRGAWFGLIAAVVLVVSLGRPAAVWDAAEIDGLAAGARLADALTTGSGGLRERARRGFESDAGVPPCVARPDAPACQRHATEAPLARWFIAGAALTAPATDDASSASYGATLALILAALTTGLLLARSCGGGAGAAALGAALLLAMPGALGSASTAGVAALGALVVALTLAAMERVARGRGAIAAGLTLGLALGLHPAGVVLLLPLFAVAAAATRPRPRPSHEPGLLPLPPVPVSLFAAPAIALIVFVASWPAAWHETTRHLGAWLVSGIAQAAPRQTIGGVLFDQPAGRAPSALVAALQWVAWTPVPLLGAWLVGVAATARAGRRGLWSPLLVLATLLVTAGLDGGLFAERRNLLSWLWAPTALTAGIGVVAMGDALARVRPNLSPRLAHGLVAALVLLLPGLALLLGVGPRAAQRFGAATRQPLPEALLARGAPPDAETTVYVVAEAPDYAHALQVLTERGPRPYRWVESPEQASRVLLVRDGSGAERSALAGALGQQEPLASSDAGGVRVDLYVAP
ncbi:MAG: hypothetical protein H6746_06475 [Deltaproteobacteria bacterium]|nr:hypothetical protein [Deltaproteobacteria bacterium]